MRSKHNKYCNTKTDVYSPQSQWSSVKSFHAYRYVVPLAHLGFLWCGDSLENRPNAIRRVFFLTMNH